jgi:hypothetical protein
VINIIQGEDWQALIMAYLCHYHEPDSTVEQTRMQQRAQSYQIINNDLYKNSVSRPLLCCSTKGEGKQMLLNVHAGLCGGHIRARALAAKILWQGFYWPAVIDDAAKLVSKCEACQRFPQDEGPSIAGTTNSPVLALTVSGHQYCQKANSCVGELHLRGGGS